MNASRHPRRPTGSTRLRPATTTVTAVSAPKPKRPAKPAAQRSDSAIAARITDLTGRVFGRLHRWATMALLVTAVLAAIAFVAAVVAFHNSSSWGFVPAVVLLAVLAIPSLAAWMLRRRADVVHRGVADLEREIIGAIQQPDLSDGLRSFLGDDGDDRDDGRAGLIRLAKGAIGVRKLVKGHRETFGHLAGSVRAIAGAPLILLVITAGMFVLAGLAGLFLLIAIF